MSKEIVKKETGIIASSGWTQEQVDLIKNTVAQGTSDDEFKLFLYQASKTGLDPLAKQIHAIMRYDKNLNRKVMSIQTGIDGYRLTADRTKHYAGSDEPKFVEGKQYPVSASVTVYKTVNNIRCPFTAIAFWGEYYPGDNPQGFFWRKMPHGQLAKCSEALALRKAFPAELSGVYIKEEMEQADLIYDPKEKTIPEKVEEPKKEITPQDRIANAKKYLERETKSDDTFYSVLESLGIKTESEIKDDEFDKVINALLSKTQELIDAKECK